MLSTLPLSYCTNVHPGQSVAEVLAGLEQYTSRLRSDFGAPLAAGLWLAAPVIREIRETCGEAAFGQRLRDLDLSCHTLNTFPYGNFHSPRVKEKVYIPDWTTPERLAYTSDCARVLADLLPDETDGSLSTVPLGFKALASAADFQTRCIENLLHLTDVLARLESETGRLVRLAIEPEPLCVLETTAETIRFFADLFDLAAESGRLEQAHRFLGVCYDICHQAVEFEDVAISIRKLDFAGIRINKVHITCAIELASPATNVEGRKQLATFVEPRYLHQTFARLADGRVISETDLSESLCQSPPADFATADSWRIHFHVPVDADSLGSLGTTRGEIHKALATVKELSYAPHLEVETYTWPVLPGASHGQADLVAGLLRELTATREFLRQLA